MAEFGSMRQISDLSTTLESDNASTCGFFAQKRQCARGFRNLPHTSVLRFQKCGKNRDLPNRPRFYASATRGFVAKNRVVLGDFRYFAALPEIGCGNNDMRSPKGRFQWGVVFHLPNSRADRVSEILRRLQPERLKVPSR